MNEASLQTNPGRTEREGSSQNLSAGWKRAAKEEEPRGYLPGLATIRWPPDRLQAVCWAASLRAGGGKDQDAVELVTGQVSFCIVASLSLASLAQSLGRDATVEAEASAHSRQAGVSKYTFATNP